MIESHRGEGGSMRPVASRRKARSTWSTRSPPPVLAHEENAAMAAPRAARATVCASRSPGAQFIRLAAKVATTSHHAS